MNYIEQANTFLERSETKIEIIPKGVVQGFPFDEQDIYPHNKYMVTLTRGMKSYSFPFYDSYRNYKEHVKPNAYSVLSSLQCYPVDCDMWEFAFRFGYTVDSEQSYRRVKKIWLDCKNQYDKLAQLFGINFIKELAEIQ